MVLTKAENHPLSLWSLQRPNHMIADIGGKSDSNLMEDLSYLELCRNWSGDETLECFDFSFMRCLMRSKDDKSFALRIRSCINPRILPS